MQRQLCSTCSTASKRQPANHTAATDMSQMVPLLHESDATGASPALHKHRPTACNLKWRQYALFVVQAALPCKASGNSMCPGTALLCRQEASWDYPPQHYNVPDL